MNDARLKPSDIGIQPLSPAQVDGTVFSILTTVYYVAGAIAILIIVIAALIFVTSAGNPERVKQAKNAIIGAVVGLLVIIMAFAITQFVIRGVS